jgi:aspartate/methionine/tyrosine aminotransferase
MVQLSAAMFRLGTESAFEVLARAQAMAATGRSIVNLCIGQPDFAPPVHVIEAAQKALSDGQHGYTAAPGILPLREAIAGDLNRRFGVEIDPEAVLVTPGSKVALFYTLLMLGEAGVEIVYPSPAYPGYESILKFSGATGIPYRLSEETGFSFSAEEVLSKITQQTRLIILNSPANPTGGITDKAQLDLLIAGLEEHPHVAVLSDEIYSRIVYDGLPHHTLLSYPSIRDRLILLDGWSKGFSMTGWRLGYAIFPPDMVPHARRIAINCHSCVTTFVQYGGIAALNGPMDAVDHMVATFDKRRHVITDGLNSLPGVTCRRPAGAFYAFPNITGTGFKSAVLHQRLLEESGVACLSGTSFGGYGEGYLRFSYAAETEVIEEAIDRMRSFLEHG